MLFIGRFRTELALGMARLEGGRGVISTGGERLRKQETYGQREPNGQDLHPYSSPDRCRQDQEG